MSLKVEMETSSVFSVLHLLEASMCLEEQTFLCSESDSFCLPLSTELGPAFHTWVYVMNVLPNIGHLRRRHVSVVSVQHGLPE